MKLGNLLEFKFYVCSGMSGTMHKKFKDTEN